MSENFTPTIVYRRKGHRKRSVAFFTIQSCTGSKPSNVCYSAISSEAPLMATRDNVISVSDCAAEKAVRSPITVSVEYNLKAAASSNGYHAGDETGSQEALVTNMDRHLDVNDNSSSSRSNLELTSTSPKTDGDKAGECSSSGALIAGVARGEFSKRDRCISIRMSPGLLNKAWTRQDWGFRAENVGACSDKYCSKPCKVCEKIESTKNMLICDNCQDAFRVTCYNPHITVIPIDEWLCGSSLQDQRKLMKDKLSSNSVNVSDDIARDGCSASEGARDGCSVSEGDTDGFSASEGDRDGCSVSEGDRDGCSVSLGDKDGCSASEGDRDGCSASESELGSLEFMFRDPEPYMPNVRIGDEFQADVSDWHGPIDEECDLVDDPLETDPCNNLSIQQELDSIKTLKCGSIGNWLQCQGVIEGVGEGVDGTICAKWRRTPLFEVQTVSWECFRCVHWDPAHADCAVPQELGTDEVMKQLKYVQMKKEEIELQKYALEGLNTAEERFTEVLASLSLKKEFMRTGGIMAAEAINLFKSSQCPKTSQNTSATGLTSFPYHVCFWFKYNPNRYSRWRRLIPLSRIKLPYRRSEGSNTVPIRVEGYSFEELVTR